MHSIREAWLKVKSWTESAIGEWGVILIIFLGSFSSFGLGRLSATEEAKPAVSILQVPLTEQGTMSLGGLVVASRSGRVYHFPWCSGAAQITEANKVWFKSEEAAEAAGYTPSKSCKGLAP